MILRYILCYSILLYYITRRLQYPVSKEYTLNRDLYYNLRYSPQGRDIGVSGHILILGKVSGSGPTQSAPRRARKVRYRNGSPDLESEWLPRCLGLRVWV